MTPLRSDDELHGWKAISDCLGVSERTAQNWEKQAGLPIRGRDGEKARVWALRSELETWKRRTDTRNHHEVEVLAARTISDGSSSGEAETAVQSNAQTSLAQSEPRANTGTSSDSAWELSRASRSNLLPRRKVLLPILASALVGLVAAFLALRGHDIATLAVDGQSLIARDATGRETWRHAFPEPFSAEDYPGHSVNNGFWIGDLDGDGRPEALFIYTTVLAGRLRSSIYCFNRRGSVLWSFAPGHVVHDSGGPILPPYTVAAFLVAHANDGRTQARIVVAGNHPTDQACQIAILDPAGHLVAEYWHPGQLYLLAEDPRHAGAAPRVLAGGVNNGEHRATLVALDPFALSGASTPYRMQDQRFRLLDMPEAHEDAVVLFPRSCLSRNEPYTRLKSIAVDDYTIRAVVTETHQVSMRGIFYEFDHDLKLRRAFLSSEYRLEHAEMERDGKLSHSANADEQPLGAALEIRRNR
jgi:hypothetical protein